MILNVNKFLTGLFVIIVVAVSAILLAFVFSKYLLPKPVPVNPNASKKIVICQATECFYTNSVNGIKDLPGCLATEEGVEICNSFIVRENK